MSAMDDVYTSQQQRCEEQIRTLKNCMNAAWGMEVPLFPMYNKRNEGSTNGVENNDDKSSVADTAALNAEAKSVVSASSGNGSSPPTQSVPLGSVLSEPSRFMFNLNQQASTPREHKPDGSRIKFHIGCSGSQTSKLQVNLPSIQEPQNSVQRQIQDKVESQMPSFHISKLNKTVSLAGLYC